MLTINAIGAYSVTVTDANNCTAEQSIQVALSELSLSGTHTDITCNGFNDGSITLQPANGQGTLNYELVGLATQPDPVFNGLPPGQYQGVVRDGFGCTDTVQLDVGEPPVITITEESLVDATCTGNDGSIQLGVGGGTPGYGFLWSHGETTEDVTGLPPGNYALTVTDNNGCEAIYTATIGTDPLLQEVANAGLDITTCDDFATMSAHLPAGLTGEWTSDPPVNIEDPGDPVTQVFGLPFGETVFNWSLSTVACSEFSSAEVSVYRERGQEHGGERGGQRRHLQRLGLDATGCPTGGRTGFRGGRRGVYRDL